MASLTAEDVSGMKVAELKAALEARNLDTKGVKKDLAARLLEALASGDGKAEDTEPEAAPAAAEEAPAEAPAVPPAEAPAEEPAEAPAEAPPAEAPAAAAEATPTATGDESAAGGAAPAAEVPPKADGEGAPAAAEEDAPPPPPTTEGEAPAAAEAAAPAAAPAGVEGLRAEVNRMRQQHHELNSLVSQWYHSVQQLQYQLHRPPPGMGGPPPGYGHPGMGGPPGYGHPGMGGPPHGGGGGGGPWTEHRTPEGHVYYYNTMSGASSWERPHDFRGGPARGGGGGGGGGTKQKGPPGANLFVVRKMRRGEYDDFDDQQLRDAFARFGNLLRAEITLDKDTGVSKGFGFVSFATVEEADAAMASMNGAMIGGRQIRIEKSSS